MKKTSLLFSIFAAGTLSAGIGPQIFSDDFSATGLFAEKWTVSGMNKSEITPKNQCVTLNGSQTMAIRMPLEGKNIAVFADLTPAKDSKGKFTHCGVQIDGITVYFHGGGLLIAACRPAGVKHSMGPAVKIPGFAFGKTYRLCVIRQKTGEQNKYVLKLDDKQIASFQAKLTQSKTVSFYVYHAKMTIDNVAVHSVTEGSSSPNLVVNSSFEYLIDNEMPPYVTLPAATWNAPYDDFLKTYGVTTKEKRTGKYGFYTIRNKAGNGAFQMYNAGCSVGQPVTGSIYLKADHPINATIGFWEQHGKFHSKKIRITTKWERYSYTLMKPEKSLVRLHIVPLEDGTIYADDAQVELGTKVTDYKPSSLDEDKFGAAANTEPKIPADIKPVRFTRAPVIDGDLSDFPKTCKITGFLCKGAKKPASKTEAYFGYDDQFFYIAWHAGCKDVNKIRYAKDAKRDMPGKIMNGECVELMLDTAFNRKDHQGYHFGVNPDNIQADLGLGWDLNWNCDFRSAVKIDRNNNVITYELAIPFRVFASPDINSTWGINVVRHESETNASYHLLLTQKDNGHIANIFPKLILPEEVIRNYRMGFISTGLYENLSTGKAAFGATLNNGSGKEWKNVTVKLSRPGNKTILGEGYIDLKPGNNSIRFSTNLPNAARGQKLTVAAYGQNGKLLSQKPCTLNVTGPLSLYNRFSFYTTEKSAEFRGTCSLPRGNYKGIAAFAGKTYAFSVIPELKVILPISDIKPGDYQVRFAIFQNGKKIASAEIPLRKLAKTEKSYCQIDYMNRTIFIEGKPVLMIAQFAGIEPWTTPVQARRRMKYLADCGYKYVVIGSHLPDNPQTLAAFDETLKRGMKVVYWDFRAWKERMQRPPEDMRRRLKDQPHLIGLFVIDEPELYAKADEVKEYMLHYMKVFPNLPVFMNNTVMGIPSRFADLTTQVVLIDDYITNREGRTVQEMIDSARNVEEAGRSERKPAWFVTSANMLFNHYRECHAAEQIAQSYGMMMIGCNGIIPAEAFPRYPKDNAALNAAAREFLNLADTVFSEEKTSAAVFSDKRIMSITRKLGNTLSVISLNPENIKIPATELLLSSEFKYADKAAVRFENRTVPVRNGIIKDRFSGWERHVYDIQIKGK